MCVSIISILFSLGRNGLEWANLHPVSRQVQPRRDSEHIAAKKLLTIIFLAGWSNEKCSKNCDRTYSAIT